PTNDKNVYILDDFGLVEDGMVSVRDVHTRYLEEYLGEGYTPETKNNKVTTDAAGKIVIIGLENGTYYLKETKAPDGYNLLPDKTPVKVGEGATKTEVFFGYNANPVTVENSKGIELPSTGGEGTMRMITIGSIVAIAFAVLLITNKKMSVYQD
ncbi:MAG: LPXTG cell wall anchor domain-containing protein, partial [Clostridia bacterium]|nr:LPXTG cell wall anchor domain-containing protein [Clostridia bacterium]